MSDLRPTHTPSTLSRHLDSSGSLPCSLPHRTPIELVLPPHLSPWVGSCSPTGHTKSHQQSISGKLEELYSASTGGRLFKTEPWCGIIVTLCVTNLQFNFHFRMCFSERIPLDLILTSVLHGTFKWNTFYFLTEGLQQIPWNDDFLAGATNASLKPEQILVSVFIPVSKKVWDYEVYNAHSTYSIWVALLDCFSQQWWNTCCRLTS